MAISFHKLYSLLFFTPFIFCILLVFQYPASLLPPILTPFFSLYTHTYSSRDDYSHTLIFLPGEEHNSSRSPLLRARRNGGKLCPSASDDNQLPPRCPSVEAAVSHASYAPATSRKDRSLLRWTEE